MSDIRLFFLIITLIACVTFAYLLRNIPQFDSRHKPVKFTTMIWPFVKIIVSVIIITMIYAKTPEDVSLDFKLGLILGLVFMFCGFSIAYNLVSILLKFRG